MSYFSRNTQQPLIKNEREYQVQEHVICIQSEDRDTLKWPSSSQFEFELPIEYKNVSGIRILDIQIPTTFYTFTHRRQNTKLLVVYSGTTYTVTIEEGTYTPEELCTELTVKINAQLNTVGVSVIVKHNAINKKIYLFSDKEISLDFTVDPYCNVDTVDVSNCPVCPIPPSHFARSNRAKNYLTSSTVYAANSCNTNTCVDTTGENSYNLIYSDAYVINHGPTAYDKQSEWGLGSYMGFNKQYYESETAVDSEFAWINEGSLDSILPDDTTPGYVIKGPTTINICDFDNIYMELDKYNCLDELEPYCYNTNAANQIKYACYKGKKIPICCNNQLPNKTYNGKHNSAIAVIPVGGNTSYQPGDSMISGTYDSMPPIPRIKKFKVKFRWHDGDLVDFNNCNVNFIIQVMELVNEINKPPSITNLSSIVF
mgnify:FL=1|tara:strand:- start:7918 stop:9198 length:1281 start_codon:yes stop_codon:yes gene_type:complete